MKLIFNNKTKYYTKEILKYFNIALLGIGIITAIILIKYKPIYKVSILGNEIGYIQNKESFKESIKENLLSENQNIDNIIYKETPEYKLALVNKNTQTNENQVQEKIEENLEITYKYYEVALNNEALEKVNTLDEAKEIVEQTKNENNQELELSILEKYTQNKDEIQTSNVEVAKTDINNKITKKAEEQKNQNEKKEQKDDKKEENNYIANISGIKIATKPITGTITSRYGESSSLRKSTHTGLDISAKTGSPIKVVAAGKVVCAKYSGSYGNLIKIDHGNGIETWYGHTSKMYVKEGQTVEAGTVIGAVGSTGNSTGPHLHFEIRINGTHVNPQKYLYK